MKQINTTTFQTSHDHLEVVVGDEKQKKFFPRVKLKAWNNEANFSVGLLDHTGKHTKKGNKIIYKTKNLTADFYPKVTPEIHTLAPEEQKAFEFSVTLNEKPDDNVIKLSIQTKGLSFHYQPPLTKKEAKDSVRPDNVIGSYAVYHNTKMNNEYKTGKAFHIYRPWAEDSAGTRVWCDLHIKTNDDGSALEDFVTITIPQDFLDSATYPVLVDPTFGYTSAGASTTSGANKILVLSNSAGATGTATGMFSYCSVASSGSAVKYGFSSYVSGGTVVAGSLEGSYTSNQAATWQGSFSAGGISAGASYDIAFWSNNPTAPEFITQNYDTLTNAGQNLTSTYVTGGFPTTLSGASVDNNRYSLYMLYASANIVRLTYQEKIATLASSSVSATYPATPVAGNLLVAAVFSNKAPGFNTISNGGGAWTSLGDAGINGSINSVTLFAKIAGSSESTTVTASASAAASMYIIIEEFAGLDITSLSGATASVSSNIATTTAAPTSSISLGDSDDLVFAVYGSGAGNTTPSSATNSFTILYTASTRLTAAYNIVSNSASTSYSTTFNVGTSRPAGTIITGFRSSRLVAVKRHSALGVG